jgi:hypothetical protein
MPQGGSQWRRVFLDYHAIFYSLQRRKSSAKNKFTAAGDLAAQYLLCIFFFKSVSTQP